MNVSEAQAFALSAEQRGFLCIRLQNMLYLKKN